MPTVAAEVIAFLLLVFVAANGAVMVVSPKFFTAFWRWWYSRVGGKEPRVGFGSQSELRIAGLVVVAACVFFGKELAEKVLSH
jgi:hypothetical protein